MRLPFTKLYWANRLIGLFVLTGLTIAHSAHGTTKVDYDAMVLAGVIAHNESQNHESLKQQYGAPQSLFNWQSKPRMAQFFYEAVPKAQKTKGLIYLFGGPDILFPQIIFPNFERLLLIGLEPAGQLDDVTRMSSLQLDEKIRDIARAYRNSLRNSYFVTSQMAKDLADKGTATMIAVGLAVQNFQILSLDEVSLNRTGEVVGQGLGEVAGIRLRFRRPNLSTAEVFYFQYDLSDENMVRRPELSEFIRRTRFDSAFYKAASYVSHLPNFKRINSLVLNTVSLIVQADDGMPFEDLARAAHSQPWDLDLYGMYTPPHELFGVKPQARLKTLYAQTICWQGQPADQELWRRVWNSGACNENAPIPFKSVQWRGYLPFRFGYGAVTGPEILTWTDKPKFSNLMILSK